MIKYFWKIYKNKKIVILIGLVVLVLVGVWALNYKNTENTKTQKQVAVFSIPIDYTEPLVIKTFNNSLQLKPVNANGSKKIKTAGNTIKYIDAYQNTDVEQIRYPNKLKESLILKGPNHPDRFEYEINVKNYDYQKNSQGDLVFYKKGRKGEELYRIFTIPKPFMVEDHDLVFFGSINQDYSQGNNPNNYSQNWQDKFMHTNLFSTVFVDSFDQNDVANYTNKTNNNVSQREISHNVLGDNFSVDGKKEIPSSKKNRVKINPPKKVSAVTSSDEPGIKKPTTDEVNKILAMSLENSDKALIFSFDGLSSIISDGPAVLFDRALAKFSESVGFPAPALAVSDDDNIEDDRFDSGIKKVYPQNNNNTKSQNYEITENTRIQERDIGGVEVKIKGNRLILIPDQDWIKNHEYPIIIDPTIEINILNVRSHPQQGENWEVEFTTQGQADLKIIPNDQSTIDDDEFIGLYCDNKEAEIEILQRDVIYARDWQCDGIGKVIHYTKKAGKHTLRFEFCRDAKFCVSTNAYNDADPSDPWWNTDWTKRRSVTINNATSTSALTNFPVMVQIMDKDTSRIDYAETQNSGEDIRFINYDGTALDYEIEKWDETATSTMWVEIPSIEGSTSTQYFYMYYGNDGASDSASSTAVWNSDYRAVYHMATATDSTTYHQDAVPKNEVSSVTGLFGDAYDFDDDGNNGDYIDTSYYPSAGAKTASCWINFDVVNILQANGCNDGSNNHFYFGIRNTPSVTWFGFGNAYEYNDASGCVADTWYYLTVTGDGSTSKYYINGVEISNDSYSWTSGTSAGSFWIGGFNHSTNYDIDGTIDEFRIMETATGTDWIAAQYESMTDDYLQFGSEESVSASLSSVTDTPDPTNPNRSVTFSVDWSGGTSAKAKICKTDSLTNQLCDGGHWATSTAFTTNDPLSVSYDVVGGDAGQTRDYYAFVCNDLGNCSSSGSGTFSVNAASTVPNIDVRGGVDIR